MSLEGEVSRLRGILYAIQRENAQLQGEINAVVGCLVAADNSLLNYNQLIRNNMDAFNRSLAESTGSMEAANKTQDEIERLYKLMKNVEMANKTIRELNNRRYYDFATNRTIRKIMQGVMDNLDLDIVDEALIGRLVERQHLIEPDYWLTCGLIAIQAWRRDDRERAEKAIQLALEMDKKSACIFFMIFNLRIEREEAALKWLRVYQGEYLTGSDDKVILMLFSLISKRVSSESKDKTDMDIMEYIRRLLHESKTKAAYHEDEITSKVSNFFISLKTDHKFDYTELVRYCKDPGRMTKMISLARNNANILDCYHSFEMDDKSNENKNLKDFIDDLISQPTAKEKELNRQIYKNELIIKYKGDVAAATDHYNAEQAIATAELNLPSCIVGWIYDNISVINNKSRRNMIALTRELNEKGVQRYFEYYRSLHTSVHSIQINDYSTQADFSAPQTEREKIKQYIDQKKAEALSLIRNTAAFVLIGGGIAAAVGALFAGTWLFILAGIALGSGAMILYSNKIKRRKIESEMNNEEKNKVDTLDRIIGDYSRLESEFYECDSLSERISLQLNQL